MRMRTLGRGLVVLALFFCLGVALSSSSGQGRSTPLIPPAEAELLRWVRSVTVQVIVRLEKHTRPLTWYREITKDGQAGEWRYRAGDWSKTPEMRVVAGTGVIVYSRNDPTYSGTLILTNAHVVEYLVRKDILGSRAAPLDGYATSDLILEDSPPRIRPREGAKPQYQYYFTLPSNYVEIIHGEDQFYRIYAKPVAFDKALDVALLLVCQPDGTRAHVYGLPYAAFREAPAVVGEEVVVCGAPLGLPFSIDRGRVNQVNLDLGTHGGIVWRRQIKLDIAGAPGSSGSGVFDKNGYIMACLHGTLVYAGQFIRGGILAIPANLIREWLLWTGWAFVVNAPPYPSAPYYKAPAG